MDIKVGDKITPRLDSGFGPSFKGIELEVIMVTFEGFHVRSTKKHNTYHKGYERFYTHRTTHNFMKSQKTKQYGFRKYSRKEI